MLPVTDVPVTPPNEPELLNCNWPLLPPGDVLPPPPLDACTVLSMINPII
jgi:hypothetical protein